MSLDQRSPVLLDLQILQKSRCVTLTFDDGLHAELPCGFLRVNSPSAEVQGHGKDPIDIKPSPENSTVNIISVEPVGNYAVKFVFDDGHKTGLYTWEYLHYLSCEISR